MSDNYERAAAARQRTQAMWDAMLYRYRRSPRRGLWAVYEDFTDAVLALLKHDDIDRWELAYRLDVSTERVNEILNGRRVPSLRTMMRVANALDADVTLTLTKRKEEEDCDDGV